MVDDKQYSNGDVKILFKKYDELARTVGKLKTFVNTEIGFRMETSDPDIEGYLWEKVNKLNDDVYGNGKMGLKNKMFILQRMGNIVSFITGTIATGIIVNMFK